MAWNIVQRRLGRAGGEKERLRRQREWDRTLGDGMWEIGYVIEGEFVPQRDAVDSVYYLSYKMYLESHPETLELLIKTAKSLRNPHALATSGVDLQVPAITRFLHEHKIELQGSEIVDIGSWQGRRSHALSDTLSPLQIPCAIAPKWTLEKFWQRKKCLAVWVD